MFTQVQEFLQACYPFGYPLLICSFIMISSIVFHLLARSSGSTITQLSKVWEETPQQIKAYAASHSNPLTQQVLFIDAHQEDDDTNLREQLETRLKLYIDSQRSGLTSISVIVSIAPMLGILGTAWGLVDIFGIFGTPEAEAGIAMGISKALYTTIFGLAIAVPGVIALSCFERKLERRAAAILALFASIIAKRHQF